MKVCFVGMGSIGKRHIKNFAKICTDRKLEMEIHLLRSSKKELDNEIERLVSKEIYNYLDLDDCYDAIFITNPTYLHFDTIEQLKDKSKVFFVEKPVFDTSSVDISVLRPDENIYYVACPLRYTSVLLKADEIIRKEKVFSARAISSSYLPEWRKNVDYRETYSAHKEQGGGVRIDLIHEWDYLVAFFGFSKNISIFSGKYSDLEIDSDDIAVYIAQYEDKLIELHLDYFGRKTRRSLEIRTKDHEYIFDISNMEIWKDGILIEKFQDELNDMYLREMENFFSIVYGGKISNNSLADALTLLKMV